MIAELEPVWKHFTETYDALRQALAEVPDDRLHWKPGSRATTVSEITRHIARGNYLYASMMVDPNPARLPMEEPPDRARMLELLAESEERVRSVFEALPVEDLHRKCADDWNPLGPEVEGPLDALWFAQQMVRHSAYHLGQINYILRLLEGESEGSER
jgi:uncharacterized damage-inducible protein DinB